MMKCILILIKITVTKVLPLFKKIGNLRIGKGCLSLFKENLISLFILVVLVFFSLWTVIDALLWKIFSQMDSFTDASTKTTLRRYLIWLVIVLIVYFSLKDYGSAASLRIFDVEIFSCVVPLFYKFREKILKSDDNFSFQEKISKIKDSFYKFSCMETRNFVLNKMDKEFITICGLEFLFDEKSLTSKLSGKDYDVIDLICIVNCIFSTMGSINARGYVSLDSLTNNFMSSIGDHLFSLGYEKKFLGNSELAYSMWFNFLFLNLYYLVVKELGEYAERGFVLNNGVRLECLFDEELFSELKSFKENLLSRLDQYIKVQVQKRGITIIQNSYTGFDTEYEEDLNFVNKNKLLSVQTSVQRRVILKLPFVEPLDISYIHPLTSSSSEVFKNKVDGNRYKYTFLEDCKQSVLKKKRGDEDVRKDFKELLIMNNSLKVGVKQVRLCLFKTLDAFISELSCKLKELKGISNFEDFDFYDDPKRNQTVFFFPFTFPVDKIAFPKGDFNFVDLLEMSK